WHFVALLATAATVVLGLMVAPAASGATGLTATFSKGSDWGTGYEGKYTINNGTSSAITSWTVEFDLAAGSSISSLWDATYTTSGSHVTVKNASWNGTVAAGGSTSFGFNVSYSGNYSMPGNCKINGGSCDGTSPP